MAAKYAINTVRFFVQDTATGLGVAALTVAGNAFTTIKLSQDGVLGADIKATITLVDEGTGWYNFATTALQANYDCIAPVVVPATATYQAFGVTFYPSKIDNVVGYGPVLAASGAASTVTLAADPYGVDSIPIGSIIEIVGGLGVGQNRVITAYNHTTKVVTVGQAWITNPDGTSIILIKQFRTAKIDASLNVYSVDSNDAALATHADITGLNNLAAGAAMTLTAAYDAAKTANSVAPDNTNIANIIATLPSGKAAGAAGGLVINDGTTPYTQKQVYDLIALVKAVSDKLDTMITTV